LNKKNISIKKINNFINHSQIFNTEIKENIKIYMIKPLFSRGKEKTINNEKNIVITIKFFYKINNKVLIRQLNKSKDDNSNNINKFIM